jgi:hypothetical protein
VPGLRTCSSLLESIEPTGALVITDTLPSTSVTQRDFPLPTNEPATVAFRTYEQRELERRWADPRRGKYRARGRIIREEGYRRGEFVVLRLCVFVGVPV